MASQGYTIPPSLIPYLTGIEHDYGSSGSSVLAVNCIFIPLVVITVALRLWVRMHMLRAVGLDDILMLIAVLAAIALSTGALVGRHYGVGEHIWNLSSGNLLLIPQYTSDITKTLFCTYIAYATAITFTKCSIIASYLRIFPDPRIRKIALATGAIVVAFWFCSVFAIIFTCVPVQAAWNYSIKNASCIKVVDYQIVAASFNIATDVVLCILPLPALWALSMPKSQRIILCGLVSMGIFACVASVMRLTQLHNLTGVDVSYQVVGTLNWSVAEVGTAIICASMSAMRPLASKYLPKIFPHLGRTTGRSNNNTPPTNSSVVKASSEKDFSQRSGDSRHIYIEQTFDIEMSPSEPDCKPPRGKAGIFNHMNSLFQRSDEELVEAPAKMYR